jgi:hypothetical protein
MAVNPEIRSLASQVCVSVSDFAGLKEAGRL